ncbi:MAG: type II secretion system protein [Synergistaceae bacterium]|nr:type II secretion system protein [Synergistaceae bacterium]
MRRKHNAFTFVEVLTTIMILGILASITIYSGTEIIVTAKAQKIVDNLMALKMATIEWSKDNMDKIQTEKSKIGQVKINGTTKPVQEWKDADLQISKYLDSGTSVTYNNNETKNENVDGRNITSTKLPIGGYGICDSGTVKVIDKDGKETIESEYRRQQWNAGYAFTADEEAVMKKLKEKEDFYGIFLGGRDAHTSNSYEAVWVKIFELYH